MQTSKTSSHCSFVLLNFVGLGKRSVSSPQTKATAKTSSTLAVW